MKLSQWEILAIGEALRKGLVHFDKPSVDRLIAKIENAREIRIEPFREEP